MSIDQSINCRLTARHKPKLLLGEKPSAKARDVSSHKTELKEFPSSCNRQRIMNKKPPMPLGSFHGNADNISISGNGNGNSISHISSSNINNISHIGSISNCSSINSSPILGATSGNSSSRMGRQVGAAMGASSSNAGAGGGGGGGGVSGSGSGAANGAGGGGSGNSSSGSSTSKGDKQRDGDDEGGFGLCGCHKAPKSHCISATGEWQGYFYLLTSLSC